VPQGDSFIMSGAVLSGIAQYCYGNIMVIRTSIMAPLLLLLTLYSFLGIAVEDDFTTELEIAERLQDAGDLVSSSSRSKIYIEKGVLGPSWIQWVTEEMRFAVKEIPQLLRVKLDRKFKGKIPTLFISNLIDTPHVHLAYESNFSKWPYVFIPAIIIKRGYAPILHELTHIFAGDYWSLSLREGLADFVQFYLRPNQRATMNKKISDFHSETLNLFFKKSPVMKYIGSDQYFFESDNERVDFYQLSRSFVAFLIDKYGGAKFMALYRTKNGYREIYTKGIGTLKKEWLKAAATSLTVDDLSKTPFKEPVIYYYWEKLKSLL
jgi:hypothetical protein